MRFDIYAPLEQDSGDALSEGYVWSLVASNVPGKIDDKTGASSFVPGLGRSNLDQMDTTSELSLTESIQLNASLHALAIDQGFVPGEERIPDDQWMVKVRSGGGQNDGVWFVINGDSKLLMHSANERKFLIRPAVQPQVTS